MKSIFWGLAVGVACAITVHASQRIEGRVVGVSDGDSITLLTAEKHQIKVRLAEIDAPEKSQAFGHRSKQALAHLCFGKEAVLSVQTIDRFGRTIARVDCAGVDANAEQVKRGYAWVYDRYAKDKSLFSLQLEARENSRGLWVDASPVAPWDFRRDKKNSAAVTAADKPVDRVPAVGGECGCQTGGVCTGPRGGRYCVTEAGNKNYFPR